MPTSSSVPSITWVHSDCLNSTTPAFTSNPTAPALWVWDDALLERQQISLKRITFIYECLLDLPVEIRRGDIANEVFRFTQEHQTRSVNTMHSPSPNFKHICHQLHQAGLDLKIYHAPPFLDYSGYLDLKRFSRYWRTARQSLF